MLAAKRSAWAGGVTNNISEFSRVPNLSVENWQG